MCNKSLKAIRVKNWLSIVCRNFA